MRRRRRWTALLPALAVLVGASCGDKTPKKAVQPIKSGTTKPDPGATPTPATPPKPKTARSKSGKTVVELINLIGDSFKAIDASTSAADLAKAEAERLRWVGEILEIGTPGLGDVIDALRHPVLGVQEWACVLLGQLGKADAAEALLQVALDDRNRNLAIYACDALGRIEGIAGAMKRLEPRLTVEPFQKGHPLSEAQAGLLRNAAAEALTRAGSKEGIPALIASLDGHGAEVRRDALVRLRRLTAQQIATTVDGPPEERRRTIAQWKQWWEANKGLYKPAPIEGAAIHQVFVGEEK